MDDRVTSAEIASEPVNGYTDTRMLFTALVPMEDLDAVMISIEGLGHGIFTCSVMLDQASAISRDGVLR
jgi:hypothetical protein